jgi:transcriptional regulator with XRE-family HTH domain
MENLGRTPPKAEERSMKTSIGELIKSLRTEQGMTLSELGDKVGLSPSYLSQIERDRTIPSLTTLVNIAGALKVKPGYFFDSGDDTTLVLRAGQALQPEAINSDITRYPLSPEEGNNILQVYRVVIQPRSQTNILDSYPGEEMCFVLSGELTVVVGDETYCLKAGDSIHYDGLLINSWSNQGKEPCEVIWSQASY